MKKIKIFIGIMVAFLFAIVLASPSVYAEEVGGFIPNQEYVFDEEDGDIYLILNEDGTAKVNGTHDDGTILEFTCEYTTCCENMHLTLNTLGSSLYLEMDEEGVITGVDYLHEEITEDDDYITSESGNFFKDEIYPILIEALSGISIGGIISFIVWFVFKRRTKETIFSSDKTYEVVTRLVNKLGELESLVKEVNAVGNTLSDYNHVIEALKKEITSIKEAIRLVVCNDTQMISTGLATKIVKELNYDGEGNKD